VKEPSKPLREVRSGTPHRPDPGLPPVPVGLQKLLRLASVDPSFRARLIAQRDTTADAAGVRLSPSERSILRAIPAEQLERMAEQLPPPRPEQTPRLRQIAANAVLLLGGAALLDGVACRKAEPTDTTRTIPDAAVTAEAEPVVPPAADVSGETLATADVAAPVPEAVADVAPAAPADAAEEAPPDVPAPPADVAEAPTDAPAPLDSGAAHVAPLPYDPQADLEANCRRQEERLMTSGGGAAPDLPDCYPPPRVTAELADLTVEGPLAEEVVRREARRAAVMLADAARASAAGLGYLPSDPCQDLRYKRDYDACPRLESSELVLVAEVGPDGRARTVRIESSPFDAEANAALVAPFRRLRFPEDQVPTRVRMTWRIHP